MPRQNYQSVYIGSNDYWGYESDTFNDSTQWFGKSWVVPSSEIESNPDVIEQEGLNRCALYYEVGKTDTHLFTPSQIIYDDDSGFLLVEGDLGVYGEPGSVRARRRAYALGRKAQRYRTMVEGESSKDAGRFEVNYILPSDDPEHKEIIKMMESLEEETEEIEASAEGFDAETLNRINPTYVEGAEDIFGAEGTVIPEAVEGPTQDESNQGFMEQWQAEGNNDIFHVIYHAEGHAIEVHPVSGAPFLADVASGAIIHDASDFASEDAEPLSAEDIGFLLNFATQGEGMYSIDYNPESYEPGINPEDFDPTMKPFEGHGGCGCGAEGCEGCDYDAEGQVIPEAGDGPTQDESNQGYMEEWHNEEVIPQATVGPTQDESNQGYMEEWHNAENVVDAFQELPLIKEFKMNGWIASAVVLGVAALSGAYYARNS